MNCLKSNQIGWENGWRVIAEVGNYTAKRTILTNKRRAHSLDRVPFAITRNSKRNVASRLCAMYTCPRFPRSFSIQREILDQIVKKGSFAKEYSFSFWSERDRKSLRHYDDTLGLHCSLFDRFPTKAANNFQFDDIYRYPAFKLALFACKIVIILWILPTSACPLNGYSDAFPPIDIFSHFFTLFLQRILFLPRGNYAIVTSLPELESSYWIMFWLNCMWI